MRSSERWNFNAPPRKTFSLSFARSIVSLQLQTHTKNAAAAVSPDAPRPRASEGKAASETGGWRGTTA